MEYRAAVKVLVVCPAPAGTLHGNRVTALRWTRILRSLGCRVTVVDRFAGEDADVLVALHARRSAPSIAAFHRTRPGRRVVVALTGTDLYRDLRGSSTARRSLEIANRIVVLQPLALRELPPSVRAKARVIRQSSEPTARRRRQRIGRRFEVLVIAHLRTIKDPMRTALAARRLPADSRIHVTHLGKAMTPALRRLAGSESARNRRYRWLGERPRRDVLKRLAEARLLVLTSLAEGGANVLSEAIVAGTPALASRIPGSVGILGADYPGYFAAGDTAGLARLLSRAETDLRFYDRLLGHCRRLAPLFTQRREQAAWQRLLREISPPGAARRKPRGRENRTSRRRRRDPRAPSFRPLR